VIFPLLRLVLLALVRLLTRCRVEGREHVPPSGALIYASNHLHYFDTPVIGVSLPRPFDSHALAGERYQRHPFWLILAPAGSIFINRGQVDRRALQQAMHVLEDGGCLAIAVEGTRSKSGALAEGKVGAAYLATRAGVPIVPVAVYGTEQIVKAWKRLRRAEVIVRIGEPFSLPAGHARSAELQAHTDTIMRRLASLLPEDYHGAYAARPAQADSAAVAEPAEA
jgi:1-acyl-sn-glycerol-3-phosphate acyltransferase